MAGRLDLTMGGPEIDFPLGLTVPRRSVYFRHAAEKQMEFLQIFDGPSVTECYERNQAIVPGQALALINSDNTAVIAIVVSLLIEGAAVLVVVKMVRLARKWRRRHRQQQAAVATAATS